MIYMYIYNIIYIYILIIIYNVYLGSLDPFHFILTLVAHFFAELSNLPTRIQGRTQLL